VSRVFWFTLEFGVVHEPDGLKAYGAGILSSPGEIEEFRGMTIRPLDVVAMGTQDYDITHYQ
jgi:phenylalanine-4-hydroxylase